MPLAKQTAYLANLVDFSFEKKNHFPQKKKTFFSRKSAKKVIKKKRYQILPNLWYLETSKKLVTDLGVSPPQEKNAFLNTAIYLNMQKKYRKKKSKIFSPLNQEKYEKK